ncbi:MAG TPA: pyruvate, phosphate dikinase, partial [bacterium]|nr:pyruvate, phosphate dikinase [bacterium]
MATTMTATATKLVYTLPEGGREMKALLGGKGANLCEMARLGLPVPPAIIVTTAACRAHMAHGEAFLEELKAPVSEGLAWLEGASGKRLGDPGDPLLVSVRSGAAVSMPGMMDTILNLGLNDTTVEALAGATGDLRFAYDCYRRFLSMFGEVVLGLEPRAFESALFEAKRAQGVVSDQELSVPSLQALCGLFKAKIEDAIGQPFPQEPRTQLDLAVQAVFRSWGSPRARSYRAMEGIADDLGTAVNIQTMVFGNKGGRSGSGVAFSRDPSTGEKVLYGEFLINAQGEDVVAGIRTPLKIEKLRSLLPECYQALADAAQTLEHHYREAQDIEFTIEDGRFYLLQTRTAKRTAQAALKIATDLVAEGMIDIPTALKRIDPGSLDALLHPTIDESVEYEVIAMGLPASPGAAVGQIVFTSEEAVAAVHKNAGARVILVREETRPDDIDGMIAAQGILTSQGGMTSHAAVVARGMGKPCVAGCDALRIEEERGELTIDGTVYRRGDTLTINGSRGEV